MHKTTQANKFKASQSALIYPTTTSSSSSDILAPPSIQMKASKSDIDIETPKEKDKKKLRHRSDVRKDKLGQKERRRRSDRPPKPTEFRESEEEDIESVMEQEEDAKGHEIEKVRPSTTATLSRISLVISFGDI
jgi:hypothetical protein